MRELTFMLKITLFLVNQISLFIFFKKKKNFNVLKSCMCSLRHPSFTDVEVSCGTQCGHEGV